MTMEAAEISAQRVIAEAYQFYPGHCISGFILTNRQIQAGGTAHGVGVGELFTHIPTNGESQGIIHITGAELGD